ncbi:hypothetical protein TCAL_05112 [Tigriopus californicus]|uniref:Uncharacterized protein n=1 Tax=Tigriopus californicus TaxID=6832 RepID=A0A553PNU2_TIGCA|nr:uncharacterized protein LOC131881830 isoform X2 [Tigriopus californicus]TRY79351.1 hypothetical protein TCAL_05112 [Tigriopus californicus]|eukprot:TCALIF_05112-PA protein Name:"Protein of unknown function" AED:0.00 eAED:0.00 QI:134/1/1/1/1/1/4/8/160
MDPLLSPSLQEVPSTPRLSQVYTQTMELLGTPTAPTYVSSPLQVVPVWSSPNCPGTPKSPATPIYDGENQNLASFESLQVDAELFSAETRDHSTSSLNPRVTKVRTKRYLIPTNHLQGSVIASNESGLFDWESGVKIRSGGKPSKGPNSQGYGANRRKLL